MKILVADGNHNERTLAKNALADAGHFIVTADDLLEAMDFMKYSKPDLLLTDINMHGRDRWDLLREIKLQNPTLPIIIYTNDETFVNDPRASLADATVVKSFVFDELKETISNIA